MIDIYSEKERDIQKIIELSKFHKIFFHENLQIKKISKDNYGIFAKNEIFKNEKLLALPNNMFIDKKIFSEFIIKSEINYPHIELFKSYYNFLPNLDFFKKSHFLFLNKDYREIIFSFFNHEAPILKKIKREFDIFDQLSDHEKYIELIFKTRAFNVGKKENLFPILDLVNYKYEFDDFFIDKNEVFFKTNIKLKKDEEFYHKYSNKLNPILFFISFSFFPENYLDTFIPKNFFSLNISENKKDKLDLENWDIEKDNRIKNKNDIFFHDHISLDLDVILSELADNDTEVNKIKKKLIDLLLNEINQKNLNDYLKTDKRDVVYYFAKSVKLQYLLASKISHKIQHNSTHPF